MSRGVFSADFARVFEDVLNIHLEDFPSRSGEIPDPQGVVEAAGPSEVPLASAIPLVPETVDLPVFPGLPDVFEFSAESLIALSVGADTSVNVMSAQAPGIEPMNAPGGGGKGKGGPPPPPPPPPADPVLLASYTSGDATVDDTEEYNILIEFYGDWDTGLMEAFGAAADFLSSVITGDLTDDPQSFRSFEDPSETDVYFTVDDILIEAYLPAIDGTGGILGQAGPYSIRSATDATTVVGVMEFDVADALSLEADGNWDAVVLHEMLHVLGLGTLWSFWDVSVLDDNNTRRPSDDVQTYVGSEGLAEFQLETGEDKLLIETDGGSGTAGGHWDEEAYGNELMTGYLYGLDLLNRDPDPYLADWSIMSLNDIGYTTVDLSGTEVQNALNSGINLDEVGFANELVYADSVTIA